LQHAQNRDTEAINLKLDELILVTAQANNKFIGLEAGTQAEIQKAKQELHRD